MPGRPDARSGLQPGAKQARISASIPEIVLSGTASIPVPFFREKSAMKKYVCDVCGWVYDPA
ncbi:MAG: hypothetical protein JXQ75_09895, partial [Phycisphaerae bacterium]|nr:hypothetical protein [Phycisphaerae bacterium]